MDFYCRAAQDLIVANVSLDISSAETRKRELNGLVEALRFFDYNQGLLLTQNHEEIVCLDGKTIIIMPLWKWLLNDIP